MNERTSEDSHTLNWFEIPVSDAARAKKFYESILDVSMHATQIMGLEMVLFPPGGDRNNRVSGALIKSPYHEPSMHGTVVYLNANPSIQDVQDRIEPAGGEVIIPRTRIDDENGYMALFQDTEGNRVALHASK